MWDVFEVRTDDPAPLSEDVKIKMSAWITYERQHAPAICTNGQCRLCQREAQIQIVRNTRL